MSWTVVVPLDRVPEGTHRCQGHGRARREQDSETQVRDVLHVGEGVGDPHPRGGRGLGAHRLAGLRVLACLHVGPEPSKRPARPRPVSTASPRPRARACGRPRGPRCRGSRGRPPRAWRSWRRIGPRKIAICAGRLETSFAPLEVGDAAEDAEELVLVVDVGFIVVLVARLVLDRDDDVLEVPAEGRRDRGERLFDAGFELAIGDAAPGHASEGLRPGRAPNRTGGCCRRTRYRPASGEGGPGPNRRPWGQKSSRDGAFRSPRPRSTPRSNRS